MKNLYKTATRKIAGITTLLLLAFAGLAPAHAQTDTLGRHGSKLHTSQLKTGLRQYLVYFQNAKLAKQLYFSLWTREISIKTQNGEQLFATTQRWYGTDTATYRAIYSLNRVKDFEPVYHAETIGLKTKAYNWFNDHIAGADSIKANEQKAFALKFDHPVLNWNLDMETYEMLDIRDGKTFVIYFYDAGIGQPVYESLKVTGSEMLTTLDNQKLDCWKLFTSSEHNKVVYTQTFWISKKNHEMLKEEDTANGSYRYKIKLPGLTPELAKRFTGTSSH